MTVPDSGDVTLNSNGVTINSDTGVASGDGQTNLNIISNSSEDNTITVNQGEANVSTGTLSITNEGTGTVTIDTNQQTNSNSGSDLAALFQGILDVNAENGNVDIPVPSEIAPGNESMLSDDKMPNITKLELSGEGDFSTTYQLGDGTKDITVTSTDFTGDATTALIYATKVTGNFGSGNDTVTIGPRSTGTDIDMGAGADTITLNLGYNTAAISIPTATVNLGDDSDSDALRFNTGSNKSLHYVKVNNFNAEDQLVGYNIQTSTSTVFVTGLTDATAATALANFSATGLTFTGIDSVIGSVDHLGGASVIFIGDNAYVIAQNSTGASESGTAPNVTSVTSGDGATLIELVGVDAADFTASTGA